ncbi:MAG: hypothetical protein ABWZ65_20240 [Pseudomonas mandelii]
MAKVERAKSCSADVGKYNKALVRAKGEMLLELSRNEEVEEKKAVSFKSFIRSGNFILEAYFEKEEGDGVPALWLSTANVELIAGKSYDIKPYGSPKAVAALYGRKTPSGIEGDAWGEGTFNVSTVSFEPKGFISGSFSFKYTNQQGQQITVTVVDTFTIEDD